MSTVITSQVIRDIINVSTASSRPTAGNVNKLYKELDTLVLSSWNGSAYVAYSGSGGAVDSVNGETGTVVLTTGDISEDADSNYVTDAEKTVIGNTSGANTGDMSNADVKTAYEANADTNAYTDSEQTIVGNTSGTNTGDQDLSGKEDDLGTPASNGYLLSSTTGDVRSWVAPTSGGDMTAAVYDPTSVADDAFDMDNMTEGSTNLILTASERTNIGTNTTHRTSDGKDHSDVVANNAFRTAHQPLTADATVTKTLAKSIPDIQAEIDAISDELGSKSIELIINDGSHNVGDDNIDLSAFQVGLVSLRAENELSAAGTGQTSTLNFNGSGRVIINGAADVEISSIKFATSAGNQTFPIAIYGGIKVKARFNYHDHDLSTTAGAAYYTDFANVISDGDAFREGTTGSAIMKTSTTEASGARLEIHNSIDGTSAFTYAALGNCVVSFGDTNTGYVNELGTGAIQESNVATDKNGFSSEQRDNVTLSFVDGTRTFSIAPISSPFYYHVEGLKYAKTAQEDLIITDVEGIHVIYYDGATLTCVANPIATQISVVIRTKCILAYIYWDATNSEQIYFGNELHSDSMSPDTHSYLHFTRGAQFLQGSGLTDLIVDGDGSLDTHAQFGESAGFMADEDLITSSSTIGSTVGLPIYYLTGASGDMRQVTQTGFSVYNTGSANGRLYYNEWTGSTWQLTEVGAGDYVLCHVFDINGYPGEPQKVAVMGQNDYINAVQARAGASEEISTILSGFPFEEIVPIATVIFQTGAYTNTVQARVRPADDGDYVDWRTTDLAQGTTATAHANLTGLGNDDHQQYALLAGRTTGQTLSGSDTTGEDLTLEDNSIDGNQITVTELIETRDNSAAKHNTIVSVTGTTYTFLLTDDDRYNRFSNAAAQTATVPPNSSVAFTTGAKLTARAVGAGQVTIAAGAGVTINTAETLLLRAQHSTATLIKVATDEWDLMGDLETA